MSSKKTRTFRSSLSGLARGISLASHLGASILQGIASGVDAFTFEVERADAVSGFNDPTESLNEDLTDRFSQMRGGPLNDSAPECVEDFM